MEEKRNLAEVVISIIGMAAKKFIDPFSGLPPEYMLSFLVGNQGVKCGYYLPVLNHWGFTEYNYLMWGIGGITLPWTHDDTWRWLAELSPDDRVLRDRAICYRGDWKACIEGIRAGQIMFVKDGRNLTVNAPIFSGGTRQGANILQGKMKRPWTSQKLEHHQEKCRFCGPMDGEKTETRGNLRYFTNAFTPYSWHWLITPTKEYLQAYSLSGFLTTDFLCEVFDIADELCQSRPDKDKPAELGIHMGSLAAQNMPHPHFAILQR